MFVCGCARVRYLVIMAGASYTIRRLTVNMEWADCSRCWSTRACVYVCMWWSFLSIVIYILLLPRTVDAAMHERGPYNALYRLPLQCVYNMYAYTHTRALVRSRTYVHIIQTAAARGRVRLLMASLLAPRTHTFARTSAYIKSIHTHVRTHIWMN